MNVFLFREHPSPLFDYLSKNARANRGGHHCDMRSRGILECASIGVVADFRDAVRSVCFVCMALSVCVPALVLETTRSGVIPDGGFTFPARVSWPRHRSDPFHTRGLRRESDVVLLVGMVAVFGAWDLCVVLCCLVADIEAQAYRSPTVDQDCRLHWNHNCDWFHLERVSSHSHWRLPHVRRTGSGNISCCYLFGVRAWNRPGQVGCFCRSVRDRSQDC